jgi:hypothetical protein
MGFYLPSEKIPFILSAFGMKFKTRMVKEGFE